MPSLFRVVACALVLAAPQLTAAQPQHFVLDQPYAVATLKEPEPRLPVRNVILLIGDGMGIHHSSAAWVANRGRLFLDNCPVTGLSRTWCTDKLITDSAASGTAMATGRKTLYKRVAMCPEGKPLDSLIDRASALGKSTGVVVTCELNDATPAAFCANNNTRADSYGIIADYPACGADFIFGGGAKWFTQRPDGRDIFKEMEQRGYQIAHTPAATLALPPGKTLAVIAPGDLPTVPERGDILRQVTRKALDTLNRDEQGFFLMVEGSKIDKEAHQNRLKEMMEELLDFDQTVGTVLNWAAKHPGTLVVITADHNTGAFSILGGNKEKGEVTCLFASGDHDGTAVPVYAFGAGSRSFTGFYENTEIFHKILAAMQQEHNQSSPRRVIPH